MSKIKYGVIYRIHNKVSDMNYIGKTTRNFKKRYGSIKKFIREKKTTSSIQDDFKEYGIDSFEVFEEIDCVYMTNDEEYDKDLLSISESYYMKKYNGFGGYNTKICDYPLCMCLIPNVKYSALGIKYKFELEDYYNFLFTDKHLNHFNKLTDTNKKDKYCEYLIKRYDEENNLYNKHKADSWLDLYHFKINYNHLGKYNIYKWFNYNEFRKYHTDICEKNYKKYCFESSFVKYGDGVVELWTERFFHNSSNLFKRYNNISSVLYLNTSICMFFEKYDIDYIFYVKDKNLVYHSKSVKFDKLLHNIVNTLNNDYENRKEYFIINDYKRNPYIKQIEELIQIRNDKLIKELKLNGD